AAGREALVPAAAGARPAAIAEPVLEGDVCGRRPPRLLPESDPPRALRVLNARASPPVGQPDRCADALERLLERVGIALRHERQIVEERAVDEKGRVDADAFAAAERRGVHERCGDGGPL